MKPINVSIIIVSWNTKDILHKCLKSVYEQVGAVEYEIIVVDNASSDSSVDMIRCEFPGVIIIANSANRGYAAAMNQGMKIARGRYFLLLNSDIIICDGAIAKTVGYADKHPEAAVVGCQVREDAEKIQMTCRRFPSLLNLLFDVSGLNRVFEKNKLFGRELMMWWPRDSEREVDVISGMLMLVSRQAVDKVGMMDESYFFLFEETDWCYRFAKAGWKMLFWPGAKVIHMHGGSQSRVKAGTKIAVHYQKSMLIFFRKHYGWFQGFAARILLIVNSLTFFVLWGILRFCRPLLGKDAQYAKCKTRAYWWISLFCIFGIEQGKGGAKYYIKKISKTLKNSVEIFFAASYWIFARLLGKSSEKVILYYHAVKPREKESFENQMHYLAKSCHVVKLSDIVTASQNGSRPMVAIIFDDAFESVKDNALPVLERYGLTAAIAVPTGVMGKSLNWWQENDSDDGGEMVLGKTDIEGINRRGYEIVSHTVSHRHLTKIDKAELKAELSESKQVLEKNLGHEVNCIVYPYGACNTAVCEAAAQAGYKFGFAVEPQTIRQSANPLCIGRFKISLNGSMLEFKLKAQGAYRHILLLRRFKRMLMGRKN